MADRVRVLVVDDHALVRAGVTTVINQQADLTVVGEAGDGARAQALWEELKPDVGLIDLRMPGMDGLLLIERLRARDPQARLIILTTYDTDDDIDRGLRAGARAYLLKDASAAELVQCIREVHAGRTRVAPAVASKLAERMTQVQLTAREMAVLRLLAVGKSNKEIGAELSITEATVKVHATHVFEKLQVTNRTEALRVALQRGLLRLP